ncbi:MFS transporter [Lutimonas vermicola]|uniref:MFS transporter n=1 Tax=Lutimonas vermicola TaxID=414288 RepID=A0ABU9KZD0_9FLAO
MLKTIIKPYEGLSREVWFMALTMLINRAGAMVVPFLSLYLTNFLEFSLEQVGWIMSCYGFGSVAGVFIGGKLADKIGYYKVMYSSLFGTGLVFFSIQFITDFYSLCLGIFALTIFADAFRPAVWVALDDYSEDHNRTRSVTLIRLAINLGFSMGPALGGLLITYISYRSLFWVDGITCLIAGMIILRFLSQKSQVKNQNKETALPKLSPYKDRRYLIFWFAMFLIGFTFMQYFSTIPLYYSQRLGLTEDKIGLMLAMNGMLIFLLEMPIVHSLEKGKLQNLKIVIGGSFLLLLSFLVLNAGPWIGLAVMGIIFMTFGEMLGFPFSNSYALDRSKLGNQGSYMALYSMSFSFAHILGPNLGMQFSARYGYEATWYLMAGICLLACLILLGLQRKES